MTTFSIARAVPWGYADFLEIDPCGLIRITGWSLKEVIADLPAPRISLDDTPVNLLQVYRTTRPDIPATEAGAIAQPGLTFEYLIEPPQYTSTFQKVSVRFSATERLTFQADVQFVEPHYKALLNTPDVLHREHIYGFGPPNPAFSPEILPLTRLLHGRVLDFGCGSGVLALHLRSQGLDAHGLELDNDLIRNSLQDTIRPYIQFYDGRFPSPYPDKSFDCVYSSEVLEHIPGPEEAVAEMARLTRDRLVLTTPDMSAIPIGFLPKLIPWHLLEATHVNFFTQTSLHRLLRRHFRHIEFGRISRGQINGSTYYVSLVAVCSIR